ncbi:MAG: hypothetical protein DRN17_05135 [Thermoplasmata archaeon]|nr:MAG: hypothetical protein DRN17_05135 [Thermoplasmata archaeon]
MELMHSWKVWEDITKRLEREGKLDEVDILMTTTVRRHDLYNELLKLSDTIEELLVLAVYAGYDIGYGIGYRQVYRGAITAR